MKKYSTPTSSIVCGIFMSIIFGVLGPMYGWWIMQTMNELNAGYKDRELIKKGDPPVEDLTVFERALPWCLIMVGGSFAIFITKSAGSILLSRVSNNVVGSVRKDLYESIIRKDIGWHDDRENSAGIMTGTLASDVQLLSGISSEGVGAQMEGLFAVLSGMTMAFIFSWPLALCTIGLLPVFIIAGVIQQKADQENMMNMEE